MPTTPPDLQAPITQRPSDRHRRSTALLPRTAAFAVAATAFFLVFAAAGTPIPMYRVFAADDGLTDSDFALASVGYFAAAVGSLLLLGRISDHVGRRAAGVAALVVVGAGTAMIPFIHGPAPLVIARVLQGVAAGIAPSALGAYAIDTAPRRLPWLSAVIAASTPMLGIPVGAVFSGLIVDHTGSPRIILTTTIVIALTVTTFLLILGPETVRRSPGLIRSLAPRLHVPHGAGRLLFTTGAAACATWSLGGFFQAFGPSVTAEYLGTDGAFIAALVFGSVMILNPVGGPIAARMSTKAGVRTGMTVFVIALSALIVSLATGSIGTFLTAALVIGVAQGIASTAAMRALVAGLTPADRAGALAAVYLVSYAGSAIPVFIAGQLAHVVPLLGIAVGYGVLGTAAAVAAAATVRDPRESSALVASALRVS